VIPERPVTVNSSTDRLLSGQLQITIFRAFNWVKTFARLAMGVVGKSTDNSGFTDSMQYVMWQAAING